MAFIISLALLVGVLGFMALLISQYDWQALLKPAGTGELIPAAGPGSTGAGPSPLLGIARTQVPPAPVSAPAPPAASAPEPAPAAEGAPAPANDAEPAGEAPDRDEEPAGEPDVTDAFDEDDEPAGEPDETEAVPLELEETGPVNPGIADTDRPLSDYGNRLNVVKKTVREVAKAVHRRQKVQTVTALARQLAALVERHDMVGDSNVATLLATTFTPEREEEYMMLYVQIEQAVQSGAAIAEPVLA